MPLHGISAATHVLLEVSQQPVPLHVSFAQHSWPGAPHALHEPIVQSWLFEHAVPPATHLLAPVSQHSFVPHVLPAQHGSFVPPQCSHAPAPLHTSVASHWLLAQHC
jgi:hypothetical protein